MTAKPLQTLLQVLHWQLRHVALCNEVGSDGRLWLDSMPLGCSELAKAALANLLEGLGNFPGRGSADSVHDRDMQLLPPHLPRQTSELCNQSLGGSVLSCCTGRPSVDNNHVFHRERAVDIDVVDEWWEAFQGVEIGLSLVAGEVVHFRNVGYEVALPNILLQNVESDRCLVA